MIRKVITYFGLNISNKLMNNIAFTRNPDKPIVQLVQEKKLSIMEGAYLGSLIYLSEILSNVMQYDDEELIEEKLKNHYIGLCKITSKEISISNEQEQLELETALIAKGILEKLIKIIDWIHKINQVMEVI